MAARKIPDVDGTEAVTPVLQKLLKDFPGFSSDQKVEFSDLSETAGITFYATDGAVLLLDREDITGHVTQRCVYPFMVKYRVAVKTGAQRTKIKELLDALGRWLERQSITLNGTEHRLDRYPELSSGNRKITAISRTSPAFLFAASQDGTEDWALSARLTYDNEFDR